MIICGIKIAIIIGIIKVKIKDKINISWIINYLTLKLIITIILMTIIIRDRIIIIIPIKEKSKNNFKRNNTNHIIIFVERV